MEIHMFNQLLSDAVLLTFGMWLVPIYIYLKNDSSFACPYLDQKKLSRSSQEYINSSIIISLIKPLDTCTADCYLIEQN